MCTWDFAIKSFMRLDFHLMADRDMGDVDDDFFLPQHIQKRRRSWKFAIFFNKINADIHVCDGISEDELQQIQFLFMKKKKTLLEKAISIH